MSEGHARQCCVWLHSLENQFNDCPCRRACFSTSLVPSRVRSPRDNKVCTSQSSFLERFCLKVTFEFLKVLRASDFRVSVLPSFSAHCWTFFQYLLVCLLSQQTFRVVKQKRFTWAHFMMTWFTTRLQLNKKDTKVDSPQLVLSLEPSHSRTWEAFVFARKRETDYCESSAVRELSKEKLWSRELLSKKRRHKRFKKGLCKDSTVKGERTKTRIPRVEVLPTVLLNCVVEHRCNKLPAQQTWNEDRFYKSPKLVYLRWIHDDVFSHCYQHVSKWNWGRVFVCFLRFLQTLKRCWLVQETKKTQQ